MSVLRRIATAVGAAALVSTALLGFAAPSASAAINPANCTYTVGDVWNVAVCSDTAPPSAWYLQVTCQRMSTGKLYTVDGNMVYGSGASRQECGLNSEMYDLAIVSIY